MSVQISDFDRFTFTLFMALALHAVLVLGITFAPELPPEPAKTMDITLSQFDDEEAPEDADYLAQTSQKGSGTEAEKQELTSPVPADFSDSEIVQVQPDQPSQTEPLPRAEQAVIETRAESRVQVETSQPMEEPVEEELPVREKKSLMERSLEIASLEARFDAQRQAYAKKPRVLRVTAASTLRSANAWYVQNWIDKVTHIGNMNYPPEAREASIHGTLRMLVSLRKDGTIKEVNILESSGSSILDDAAIRIVRLAAPFSPFPDQMKEQTDELEIIRTWTFQPQGVDFRMTMNADPVQSLAGYFLVATPYLGDPRFHGGVIYLCEHSSEGALGLMVNRPLDISLGEILEQLDMEGGELDCPVFSGGPVEPERGFVLHEPAAQWQQSNPLKGGIVLTTSRDILESIGAGEGPENYRVALGYAGWSEGQLESELAGNAWLTCQASTDLLLRTPWQDLYGSVLAHMGVDMNQLSETIGHA